MDTKGAIELTRRLLERHGAVPEATPPATVAAPHAAPIFRWFGVEPPAQGVDWETATE